MKISNKISIIIRTKNEERWIGHSIQSIIDNFKNSEIIIIDNNSKDETLSIVKNFIKDPNLESESLNYTNIKIINIDNYTPGKSINLAIQSVSNDIVMILSAHCVIKNFNIKVLNNLSKYNCIFGKQIPIWQGKKISLRYIWNHFVDKQVVNMYSDMEERYFFHNAASLFKTKILIDNPFDEYLAGKEDRYWINDYVKKGNNYLYDPDFEVLHHYTVNGNTWKGLG